eukprot:gene28351-37283_t
MFQKEAKHAIADYLAYNILGHVFLSLGGSSTTNGIPWIGLKEAFLKLIVSGVIAMVAGMVYFIVMLSSGSGSLYQIIGFTMAMSNTYGVLLITILMGNGLVGIPKRLWLMADRERELQRLFTSAIPIEEEYQEARYELEDLELEVRKVVDYVDKAGASSHVFKEIGTSAYTLKTIVSNFNFSSRSTIKSTMRSGVTGADAHSSTGYSEKDVVSIHARLIKAQLKARSAERRWTILIAQARKSLELQNESAAADDIEARWCTMQIDYSVVSGSGGDGSSSSCCSGKEPFSCCVGWCGGMLSTLRIFWLTHCRAIVLRAAAIVTGCASCLILWSEMLMASQLRSPMALMMGDPQHLNPIVVQGVSFLFLSYMSVCTYWTLFRINIGWEYKLQGPQQSPPSSLIFNAEYFSRLQFSVGYNFILCLNLPNSNKTAFDLLMQNMETVPVFGASFTVYVPIVMVLVALITLFDGLPRILKLIGVETEDSPTLSGCWATKNGLLAVEDEERIRLGKAVIMSEIKHGDNNYQSKKKAAQAAAMPSSSEYTMVGAGGGSKNGTKRSTTISGSTSADSTGGMLPVSVLSRSYMNVSKEEKVDEDEYEADTSLDFNKYISGSNDQSPLRRADGNDSDNEADSSPQPQPQQKSILPSTVDGRAGSRAANNPTTQIGILSQLPSALSIKRFYNIGSRPAAGADFQLSDSDGEPLNRGRYSDI